MGSRPSAAELLYMLLIMAVISAAVVWAISEIFEWALSTVRH